MGARLPAPTLVDEGEGPFRPELALWLELPEGLIVGQRLLTRPIEEECDEPEEGGLAQALREALERPMVGAPRRPERVRVPEHVLVPEVRAVLGEVVPVEVAPTPELEELVEALGEALADSDEGPDPPSSYLESAEGGRLPPERMGELFESAAALYRTAPWERIAEEHVIRADVPELGVEGACLSVLGELGESVALLVFPSLEAWEVFAERLPEEPPPSAGELDLGTGWLALSFQRGAELPAALRREIAQHGWPVADASAYPVLQRYGPDAVPEPPEERDVRIASRCAGALAALVREHGAIFETWESDHAEGISAWLGGAGERGRVRLTAPYDSLEKAEAADVAAVRGEGARAEGGATPQPPAEGPEAPAARSRRVGRNEPCPCGSGRKYKRCHLREDEAQAGAAAERHRLHDLDDELAARLAAWAADRFGPRWKQLAERDFAAPEQALDLVVPWAVYGVRVDGRTVLEAYLEEEGRRLSSAERAWAEAQRAAWLSVWEVQEVSPEESALALRDLLSHAERRVRDVEAARTVPPKSAILARVVDHAEGAFLCGTHPRPLPPERAADLVRRARGRLGRKKRAVPPERLRDEGFARYLLRRWREDVADLDAEAWLDAEVLGPDDRPLELITDRFDLARGARAEVAAHLAAVEGALVPEREKGARSFFFLESSEDARAPTDAMRVLGRAEVSEDELVLQSYSAEGAEILHTRLEAACGELLRHRARDHVGAPPAPGPRASSPRGPSRDA